MIFAYVAAEMNTGLPATSGLGNIQPLGPFQARLSARRISSVDRHCGGNFDPFPHGEHQRGEKELLQYHLRHATIDGLFDIEPRRF